MNLEQLDKEYSPSKWSKRMSAEKIIQYHVQYIESKTQQEQLNWAAERLRLDVVYDTLQTRGKLDIYYGNRSSIEKVLVYVHGGYWAMLGKDSAGWFASEMCKSYDAFVALDYELCPNVTVSEIVQQVCKGIAWVKNEFPMASVDVLGHSAGAHLCAMALLQEWKEFGLNGCTIRNAFLISGIYDLEPIRQSYVNEPLQLTKQEAESCSPLLHCKRIARNSNVFVMYAEHDSPEFQKQSEKFAKSIYKTAVKISNVDHFDIMEKLNDEHFQVSLLIQKASTAAHF